MSSKKSSKTSRKGGWAASPWFPVVVSQLKLNLCFVAHGQLAVNTPAGRNSYRVFGFALASNKEHNMHATALQLCNGNMNFTNPPQWNLNKALSDTCTATRHNACGSIVCVGDTTSIAMCENTAAFCLDQHPLSEL